MKRLLFVFIIISLFMGAWTLSAAAREKPDYEKYGRIATAVVKEDFPGEDVVEYQYTGRQKVSASDVTDSFTFQVNEAGKPVTLIVKVTHSLDNKRTLSLTVEEKRG
ncbi:YqzG/YhdC family protein [Cytobacillus solani]|uniref:DUF3889 domain-containing protein n=1 Tax=Cytobacillus solani TaxID=1637975 RepID=UPI00207ABF2D|nr:DUF3889 domain-containing protein [Cytobacillus solani]USK56414.1 YqzG/YhdC family protein [Cytobacillus solani]